MTLATLPPLTAAPVAALAVADLDEGVVRAFLAHQVDADALPEPSWGPIGKEVYERTYSRTFVDADGVERREVWAETVRRVVLGNLAYAPAALALPDEDVDLFRAMYCFGVLPAGRHISATGTAIVANRNCFHAGWEERTSAHTAWLAKVLFLGGGVGANYSLDLTSQCKPIISRASVQIVCSPDHPDIEQIREFAGAHEVLDTAPAGARVVRVEDSREGWADAWALLIDRGTEEGNEILAFDITGVRPKGAVLNTMGGTASGPAPLAKALLDFHTVLAPAVGRQLTGMDFMALDHAVAEAVCSGGSRRSARMSMMRWADPEIFEFITCKDDSMSHWTTNISVETDSDFALAIDHQDHPQHVHALFVLTAVSKGMARNGEPGFVNTEAHSVGEKNRIRATNPCGEVSLENWESCNIGSVNLDFYGTDFGAIVEATRMLSRFLYRATLKAYPDERAAEVEGRNRRIGPGILGLHGWALSHGVKLSNLPFDADLRAKLTQIGLANVDAANQLADQLGLPRPIKVGAIAPTGTISSLAGTTPGVAPVIYKRFTRRVRYTDTDVQVEVLRERGFHIEPCAYAANTVVVSFPVQDQIMARFPAELIEDSTEISFSQFMAIVQCLQDTILGPSGNAVSATAQIPADMDPTELAMDLMPYLRGNLKGVTAFPAKSFVQPPFSPLTEDEYTAALSTLEDNADFYRQIGDSNDGSNCATGACPVV
ncbi:MAG: ribonucleoside-triphosphate reductase, adenosylcobalamin-dependent [Nakamurella sp.]